MSPNSAAGPVLSHCGEAARREDNDRFLTALFAPEPRREASFALIAFNGEIARVAESVKEPTLGQMRLQWWRDMVAACAEGRGQPMAHPVAEPLAEAIAAFKLSPDLFDALIDAREADLDEEPPHTLDELDAYAASVSAPLIQLTLEVLDARDAATDQIAQDVGAAFALAGLMRATPMLARRGVVRIPMALLEANGLRRRDVTAGPGDADKDARLAQCVAAVCERARKHLTAARAQRGGVGRSAIPAFLPATLAGLGLDRLAKAGHAPFSRLALAPHPWRHPRVAWAAFTGRW